MYNNIVFDLGGVVVDYAPRQYLINKFYNEEVEIALFSTFFNTEEWLKLDEGTLTFEDASKIFLQRGREMDIEFEMQVLIDDWLEMLKPKKETISLISELRRSGYSLYYLSNLSQDAYTYLAREYDLFRQFKGGVCSFAENLLKPNLAIYQRLLDKYGLDPLQTIFIDDSKLNADTACKLDIQGLHFSNINQIRRLLHSLDVEVKLPRKSLI